MTTRVEKIRLFLGRRQHTEAEAEADVAHLLFVPFVGELDVDVVVFADLGDDGSFAADDLGVELGIYGDDHLEAPQSLRGTDREEG